MGLNFSGNMLLFNKIYAYCLNMYISHRHPFILIISTTHFDKSNYKKTSGHNFDFNHNDFRPPLWYITSFQHFLKHYPIPLVLELVYFNYKFSHTRLNYILHFLPSTRLQTQHKDLFYLISGSHWYLLLTERYCITQCTVYTTLLNGGKLIIFV